MLTPKGNFSGKVKPGMTFKRHLRTEQVARLVLMGLDNTQIGLALGVTSVRISQIRRTPEFVQKITELHTGVISAYDRDLRDNTENFTKEVKEMVPTALLAIRDALTDKSNPRIRFEAAKQVLDREGTTAIVSKSEVKRVDEFDYSKHEQPVADILQVLAAIHRTKQDIPLETSSANNHANNSINSINSISGDIEGAAEFKNAHLDKDAQQAMYEKIDLTKLDFKDAKVQ